MKVSITGRGGDATTANRVLKVAISLHPALGEVNSNWVTLPSLVQCSPSGTVTTTTTIAAPSNFPVAFFGGWTGGESIRTAEINQRAGVGSCLNGVCTWESGSDYN